MKIPMPHEYAALFPMASESELAEMAKDIKARAVKVGKGYRLLRPSETLQEGDQYWCPLKRRWVATCFEGAKPKGTAYRRRIKQGAAI